MDFGNGEWRKKRMNGEVTGVILAGGKSRRFGSDKALTRVQEHYLIEFPLKILYKIFDEILIVTSSVLLSPIKSALSRYKNLRIVTDIYPEHGALGGIYTALLSSGTPYIFVTACDMPFLNSKFIKYMLSIIENEKGIEVIIPKSRGGYEALHAIYNVAIKNIIKNNLVVNKNKIIDSIANAHTYVIPYDDIKKFDKEERMFKNINTQQQLRKLLA